MTPPDASSYRRLRAKKPSSARTTTMMMIQTMMLKTHLLWYALFCPVVSTVTHSGSRCLASSSSGSRRSTSGVNASSSKAIPLSGGLVIRNRRSRSRSSRRCQLLAVAPRSLVLGTACLRLEPTPGFRGRVLVGWLYLSCTVPCPSPRFLTRGGEWPAELATMEQALERLDAHVLVSVAKFGRRGCAERDLGRRRQALVDEPLEPTQRSARS